MAKDYTAPPPPPSYYSAVSGPSSSHSQQQPYYPQQQPYPPPPAFGVPMAPPGNLNAQWGADYQNQRTSHWHPVGIHAHEKPTVYARAHLLLVSSGALNKFGDEANPV
ncbi:hypothetical protein FA95DRAFT_1568407 [Auriscalpium vulgare]|uniref:Uncharacterized protein n=1 Tax=Auriscalpium vulgare TaxID=40419 RepID=A0ACB8SDC0_9AGAM|nr:hypothetical protein FA95DRAFT_1568407 [Auriscalpium vulgare]